MGGGGRGGGLQIVWQNVSKLGQGLSGYCKYSELLLPEAQDSISVGMESFTTVSMRSCKATLVGSLNMDFIIFTPPGCSSLLGWMIDAYNINSTGLKSGQSGWMLSRYSTGSFKQNFNGMYNGTINVTKNFNGQVSREYLDNKFNWMDGWMNGVLGHFYALSRLNWAWDKKFNWNFDGKLKKEI